MDDLIIIGGGEHAFMVYEIALRSADTAWSVSWLSARIRSVRDLSRHGRCHQQLPDAHFILGVGAMKAGDRTQTLVGRLKIDKWATLVQSAERSSRRSVETSDRKTWRRSIARWASLVHPAANLVLPNWRRTVVLPGAVVNPGSPSAIIASSIPARSSSMMSASAATRICVREASSAAASTHRRGLLHRPWQPGAAIMFRSAGDSFVAMGARPIVTASFPDASELRGIPARPIAAAIARADRRCHKAASRSVPMQ